MPRNNNNNNEQFDDVPDLSALFDEEAIDSVAYQCCPTLPPLHYVPPFTFIALYHGGTIAQALTERRDHTNTPIPTYIIVFCAIGAFIISFEVNGRGIVRRMEDACILFRSGTMPMHWRDRREELQPEWQPLSPKREKLARWLTGIGTLSLSIASGFAGFVFLDNMPNDYENFPWREYELCWKSIFGVTGVGIAITSNISMFMPYYSCMRKLLMKCDDPFLIKFAGTIMWVLGTSRVSIQTYSVLRELFAIENNASIGNYCLLGSIVPVMPLLGVNSYIICTEGLKLLHGTKKEEINWQKILSFAFTLSVAGLLIDQLYFLNASFLTGITEDYDEYDPDTKEASNTLIISTALLCLDQLQEMMLGTYFGTKSTVEAIQRKVPTLLAKFSCLSRSNRLIANDAAIDEQSPLINDQTIALEETPKNRCGIL